MYSTAKKLSNSYPLGYCETAMCCQSGTDQPFGMRKRFVTCICPKCTMVHQIYMLWTGRGMPRKYCSTCKPRVARYDRSAQSEAAVLVPGHSKKRGRRCEGGQFSEV